MTRSPLICRHRTSAFPRNPRRHCSDRGSECRLRRYWHTPSPVVREVDRWTSVGHPGTVWRSLGHREQPDRREFLAGSTSPPRDRIASWPGVSASPPPVRTPHTESPMHLHRVAPSNLGFRALRPWRACSPGERRRANRLTQPCRVRREEDEPGPSISR